MNVRRVQDQESLCIIDHSDAGELLSVSNASCFYPTSVRSFNAYTRESCTHTMSSRARVCQDSTALRILILSAILG